MTLDERIEALTQRVELLSQMHQDNEVRFLRYFETASASLKTLTGIAELHEQRITDLERRNEDQ